MSDHLVLNLIIQILSYFTNSETFPFFVLFIR